MDPLKYPPVGHKGHMICGDGEIFPIVVVEKPSSSLWKRQWGDDTSAAYEKAWAFFKIDYPPDLRIFQWSGTNRTVVWNKISTWTCVDCKTPFEEEDHYLCSKCRARFIK
jgi:hypothetical protein